MEHKAIATASPEPHIWEDLNTALGGVRKYMRTVTSVDRHLAKQGNFLSLLHASPSPSPWAAVPNIWEPAPHQERLIHYPSLILTAQCSKSVFFPLHQNCLLPSITFPQLSYPTGSHQTYDSHNRNWALRARKSIHCYPSPISECKR